MSYDDARAAITQRFSERWAASEFAAVPVWYPNQSFNKTSGAYIALSIVGTGGDAASIGAPGAVLDRYTGFVQVDSLVPNDTGESTALKMAEVAAAALRRAELNYGASGNITFGVEGEPVRLPHPGKYRITTRVPYRRDILN